LRYFYVYVATPFGPYGMFLKLREHPLHKAVLEEVLETIAGQISTTREGAHGLQAKNVIIANVIELPNDVVAASHFPDDFGPQRGIGPQHLVVEP
jgi:hypothetical protein